MRWNVPLFGTPELWRMRDNCLSRPYPLMEEIPEAYKDVSHVVDVVHGAGISRKVAHIRPLGVITG